MRRAFSTTIESYGRKNEKLIFLTGDLGFMAFETLASTLGNRFINAGVSEQNMISVAAGLASQGLLPVCYSIAPFAVFRPAEQLRIDLGIHNMNVKIVGNGGGYGYGIMGSTHHALEDLGMVSSFQNFICFIPCSREDVADAIQVMFNYHGPSYLRLGSGTFPASAILPGFSEIRQILSGEKMTVVCLGPMVINALTAIEEMGLTADVDLFVVSVMPLENLTRSLLDSIRSTRKLLVLEDHVSRGGLGEHLAWHLVREKVGCDLVHRFATGYPNGLYGSQHYHHVLCGLDAGSIKNAIKTFMKHDS